MSELDRLFAEYDTTMTAEQVARLLHIEMETLYRALRSGRLPGYKAGGSWVIVTAELRNHLMENRNSYRRRED